MTIVWCLLAAAIAPGLHGSRSAPCARCHPEQASQWNVSLHAHSLTDPLYVAMRAWAVRDAGPLMEKKCATCHSVAVEGSGVRTGSVQCRVCHQGASRGKGPEGWRVDPSAPVMGPGTSSTAPHATSVSGDLLSGAVCLVCHGQLKNPRGVMLCSTGLEAASRPTGPGCLDCHMRGGDHRFDGTSRALLSSAASLAIDRTARGVQITVLNRGSGHGLPTGSALRQVHLVVSFMDGGNRRLQEHREVFSRVFADAQGQAPVPPWRAASVARDTRLGRGERRVFTYPVPAGARQVEARLVFRRAPAKIARRLGLEAEPSLRPVVMSRIRASLRRR